MPEIIPEVGSLEQGLTGSQLAKRLNVDGATISRESKRSDFKEWCRAPKTRGAKGNKIPDPDGYGWEKRGKLFYPIP